MDARLQRLLRLLNTGRATLPDWEAALVAADRSGQRLVVRDLHGGLLWVDVLDDDEDDEFQRRQSRSVEVVAWHHVPMFGREEIAFDVEAPGSEDQFGTLGFDHAARLIREGKLRVEFAAPGGEPPVRKNSPRSEDHLQGLLREVHTLPFEAAVWKQLLHAAERSGRVVMLVGWDKKPPAPLFEFMAGRSVLVPRTNVRGIESYQTSIPGRRGSEAVQRWLIHTGPREGWGEISLYGLALLIRDGKVSVQVEAQSNPPTDPRLQNLLREVNRGSAPVETWERLLREVNRIGQRVALFYPASRPASPSVRPFLVYSRGHRSGRLVFVSGLGHLSLEHLSSLVGGRQGFQARAWVEVQSNPSADDGDWWEDHVETPEELRAAQSGLGRQSGRVRGWDAPVPLPVPEGGQSAPHKGRHWLSGTWWRIHPLKSNLRWDQVIASDADPDPRRLRKTQAGASRWRKLERAAPDVWEHALLSELQQRSPQTFNSLVVRLSQGRSDGAAQLGAAANVALWNLVAAGEVQHTDEAPIFFARRIREPGEEQGGVFYDVPLSGRW